MTNKTEDRFYFGKHGQPERFAIGNKDTMATLSEFEKLLKPHWDVLRYGETKLSGTHDPRNPDNEYRYQAKRAISDFVDACMAGPRFAKQIVDDIRLRIYQYIDQGRDKSAPQYRAAVQIAKALDAIRGPLKSGFSRPGKPDEFDLDEACWDGYEPVGTKRKDGRTVPNCVPMKNEKPERFAESLQAMWDGKQYRVLTPSGAAWYSNDGKSWTLKHGETVPTSEVRKYNIKLGTGFSRPGQPDEFDLEEACWDGYEPVGTKRKDGRTVPNCVPMKNAAGGEEKFGNADALLSLADGYAADGDDEAGLLITDLVKMRNRGLLSLDQSKQLDKIIREARSMGVFSRPGQPERFDASSLDRKGFAAASSSPMLGKLLSEKQMPEGGWRAVETGGGSLVISFEDGDVAGNFARRVASNGYSATAPVQSIGRYWNVEVKNG